VAIRTGLVIAVASIGVLAAAWSAPAAAQTAGCTGGGKISKTIAKPMIAAQDAMRAKKWQEALNKLKEAEAQPGAKSQFDQFHISEIRGYVYTSLRQDADAARELEAGLNSPCMAEAKKPERVKTLLNYYIRLRNYPKAIDYGNRALKVSNDSEIKILLAQAYYQSGNNKEAIRVMNDVLDSGARAKENDLLLIRAACDKAGNNDCVTRVFEKLVLNYPKTEYWSNLMVALRQGDNDDVQQLNVFRLSNQVNVMKRADEYKEMAQLAIDEQLSCEAQSILEQGFTKKVFVDKRDVDVNTRLLGTASAWPRRRRSRARMLRRRRRPRATRACELARSTWFPATPRRPSKRSSAASRRAASPRARRTRPRRSTKPTSCSASRSSRRTTRSRPRRRSGT
jgi:tetratricopeptide (TPR) repeat protein